MSRIVLVLVALSLPGCKHKPATDADAAALPEFSCMSGFKDMSAKSFPDPEPGTVSEIDQSAIYHMWPDGEPLHAYKCPLHNGRPVRTMCCDQGLVVTW